ncbi:MAG: hypothetical protein ACXWJ6_12875 [Xanthobacteraceae bacterium]
MKKRLLESVRRNSVRSAAWLGKAVSRDRNFTTSNVETNIRGEAAWRRYVISFISSFAAVLLVVVAVIALTDPYDSGRLFSALPPGVLDESPRTANVSRGRDPNFNSAIFGNSYSQLIDPARLDATTGLRFVQMTVPGSGPREQHVLLRWFVQHHDRIGAVVTGIDEQWCQHDVNVPLNNPFPFWLYGDRLEFLINHLNSHSLVLAARRIHLALGGLEATHPAGYWDYELGREWGFRNGADDQPYVDLAPAVSTHLKYPVLDALINDLALLPKNAVVIVVMPPRFRDGLPAPDSDAASDIAGCKHHLMEALSLRPRSTFVDYFLDTAENRDPTNFMDQGHYRAALARSIEARIKEAIEREAHLAAINASSEGTKSTPGK